MKQQQRNKPQTRFLLRLSSSEFWGVIMDSRRFIYAQMLSLAEHPVAADMYNEISS